MKLPRSKLQLEESELPAPARVRVEVRLGDTLMTFHVPGKQIEPFIVKWKKRKYLVKTVKVKTAKPNKRVSGEPKDLVKFHRIKKKLSQAQLAKKLETSQAAVSQIESGSRGIGKDMARRLAKVLDVNYREFL